MTNLKNKSCSKDNEKTKNFLKTKPVKGLTPSTSGRFQPRIRLKIKMKIQNLLDNFDFFFVLFFPYQNLFPHFLIFTELTDLLDYITEANWALNVSYTGPNNFMTKKFPANVNSLWGAISLAFTCSARLCLSLIRDQQQFSQLLNKARGSRINLVQIQRNHGDSGALAAAEIDHGANPRQRTRGLFCCGRYIFLAPQGCLVLQQRALQRPTHHQVRVLCTHTHTHKHCVTQTTGQIWRKG